MRIPSIERLGLASAGGRPIGLCLSSGVLTPSGSDRPTTFRTSGLSYPREPSTRQRGSDPLSPWRPARAVCANSLAGHGSLWSVTHEGRRQEAARPRRETRAVPLKQRPRADHGHLKEGEVKGCFKQSPFVVGT